MIEKIGRAMRTFGIAIVVSVAISIATTACTGEGVDPSTLPEGPRADYAVFAQRCSKCHSLSRPLNAGIRDDAWWELYVTRMRRQPSSGISEDDQKVILRFLHYYAQAQAAQRDKANAVANPDHDAGAGGR